ncbi:enoyl reductase-like protein [Streptomyces sp. SAI-117]|uniref:hypothetical protein n=1 Tax=unclassified Streptomyces TaxID=2593676 RepID=UPI002472F708|nr:MULTISPECIES: hypothetical protein [unclassified Streptomyces]MDH6568740.1 enoyl reductase-like protein [Streptomyces sp. SAI-117]MDH6586309.1 enoyl reductase-like protein [Streptomyces sp. SAI-133]
MTKRISALAVSAAIVGGLFLTSVPAQAAPSAGEVSIKASVTCNKSQMRQQIASLKTKAAKLKQLGENAAARKALSDATALQRKLDACIKAEEDTSKPFPG